MKDMKTKMKLWMGLILAIVMLRQASAQQVDAERMNRDIEVAENVLATLIRNEINEGRFFGLEVKAHYQEGYGVTFRLPSDYAMPFAVSRVSGGQGTTIYYSDDLAPVVAMGRAERERAVSQDAAAKSESSKLKTTTEEKRRQSLDSARNAFNAKMIKASKDFILDYGDFISQLQPNEKIVITNQSENRSWYFKENKRTHISIEASKSDITAFRQGKISREQALAKLKVVNTEFVDVKEPDLELMSTIMGRLYRKDLSTTFFSSESNIYYERLRDYGVIFHMPVFSSEEENIRTWRMPTVKMEGLSKEERDKKVVELYPKFEQEMKENMVEYGRTVKSLKDEEVMVFDVTLTKCVGCGIPSTTEFSVKGSVLKDYASGKINMSAATGKVTVKKGPKQ